MLPMVLAVLSVLIMFCSAGCSCACSGISGSACAMLVAATFALDERLAPCYKSASVVKQWALRSVVRDVRE